MGLCDRTAHANDLAGSVVEELLFVLHHTGSEEHTESRATRPLPRWLPHSSGGGRRRIARRPHRAPRIVGGVHPGETGRLRTATRTSGVPNRDFRTHRSTSGGQCVGPTGSAAPIGQALKLLDGMQENGGFARVAQVKPLAVQSRVTALRRSQPLRGEVHACIPDSAYTPDALPLVASFGATAIRIAMSLAIAFALIANVASHQVVGVIGILLIMVLDHYDGVLFKRCARRGRVLESSQTSVGHGS